MFFLGSAYPLGKFGLNASMNPIFFGALRMGFVFLCLLPFCKIIIPKKKYLLPLIGFSLCMGAGVNMFLYLSINAVTLLAPITIGAQLSIPFAILISSLFLKESISLKKWIFIFLSFFSGRVYLPRKVNFISNEFWGVFFFCILRIPWFCGYSCLLFGIFGVVLQ